ncbi:MAG: TonB-dependent receptor [Acidobacteria bacterium]|nr:TonB-dependent receptor [Acidobacteriota bacterium]
MKKFFLMLTFLAFTGLVFAGTTGKMVGKIVDESGTALPGVTVVVTSPALQGQKSTATDANGKYRLILLPPGMYQLTATLPGFQTITMKGIKVTLESTVEKNFTLKAAKLSESIVVTAEKPLIDQATTTTGQTFSTNYVEQIPTGRSYLSVVQLTPGVTGSDISGGMIVNGASGTESNYIIDGMNTTDVENGTQGKGLNFDFVQEVQVKTGGYEAEFGQSMGAVVNVITKSGGNEFHGSAFYYFRNPSFSAKSPTPWFGSSFKGQREYDYGFSFGGPIIKDKLWFFMAYNPSTHSNHYTVTDPMVLQRRGEAEVTHRTESDYWALKLTYNINENNTLVFSTFGDPTDYYYHSSTGDKARDRLNQTGGTDWTLKYDSILTDNLVLSAQYGQHFQKRVDSSLDGNDGAMTWDRFGTGSFGGLGYMENVHMERDMYKVSLEYFWGNHDIKGGIQYEENKFDSARRYSGGVVYRYQDLGSAVYVRRRMFAIDDPNGELIDYYISGDRFHQLTTFDSNDNKTETDNTAYFLQDKWNVTDNLMLSIGIRHAEQKIKGNSPFFGGPYTAIDIDDMDSPRIGLTYDIFGDGASKLYTSWGTFYENVPMDINNRAFAQEVLYFDYWVMAKQDVDVDGDGTIGFWDFNANNYDWNYATNSDSIIFTFPSGAGGPAPVADGLKGTSDDEFIVGYEQLLNDNWSAGVRFKYRSLNHIIEDVSFDDGNHYVLANPGEDINYTDNDGTVYNVTAEQAGFVRPKRNYRSYEMTLKRKYADNWQMDFTYTHSKLWGNYIGGVLPFYGQVDPNLTAAYDLPSTLVNTEGVLPYDRPHQIKWNGLYKFDFGLVTGWSYTYYSGTPIAAYGNPDDGSTGWYGEFRLITNGAPGLGRTDAVQSLDLNFSYTYEMGKLGSLTGYFYIYNVLNSHNVTAVNQRFTYDTPSAQWLSDHNMTFRQWATWIDGRFHSLNELEQFASDAGMSVYENFLKPESFQSPRYIRFGIKYKF